jgi:3-oxoacyl-[acyl-carrier-protein] synthase-3
MDGREVYRNAVEAMTRSVQDLLKEASVESDEVDLLIAHQANARILNAVAARLGWPPERVMTNIARVGNTSAASIPLAIAEARESGVLKENDRIVLTAFGAGFAWGSGLVRWGKGATVSQKPALAGEVHA